MKTLYDFILKYICTYAICIMQGKVEKGYSRQAQNQSMTHFFVFELRVRQN